MKKLILIISGSTAWAEADLAENEQSEGKKTSDSASQAETAENASERRLQGTLPLPLSEQGKDALGAVAEVLKHYDAQTIYSSGNESSGPTAAHLAELCNYKNKKNTDLKELDCGLWQGLRFKDIEKRYSNAYKQWRNDPESICPPDGELFADCRERIESALLSIIKKSKSQTIVIVVAEIAAAIIECLLTDKISKDFWDVADSNSQIRIFELSEAEKGTLPKACPVKTEEKQ